MASPWASFKSWIARWFGMANNMKGRPSPPAPPSRTNTLPITAAAATAGQRAIAVGVSSAKLNLGGRQTYDSPLDLFASSLQVLMPLMAEDIWRYGQLDVDALEKVPPWVMLDLLAEIEPDVSRALWDFQRLCNPGYDYQCFQSGFDPDAAVNARELDAPAKQLIDNFIAQLNDLYGAFDVVISRFFSSAYLRGALFSELVFDADNMTPLDLATPDPMTVVWKRLVDPVRGPYWQPGQLQFGVFVALTRPTVRYLPVDPGIGRPVGRAPANPALFAALFLLGMLHDLRRVVANQGYPRHDLEILLEELIKGMPLDVQADPEAASTWIDEAIQKIVATYEQLQPDSTFIHTNVIKINRPMGAVSTDSMTGFDELIKALERFVTRALKTMPLLMGINDTTTETHAIRQWEIHVQGIKSIQHLLETTLERYFTMILRANGSQAVVRFRFAELRASEELRYAQTDTLVIKNAMTKRDQGWISQDEAAVEVTGHRAVGPAPPPGTSTNAGDLGNLTGSGASDAATGAGTPASEQGIDSPHSRLNIEEPTTVQ